jgi:hypothetical protein
VISSGAYQARTARQVTGFNLTGFDGGTEEVSIPEVGDVFPGNSGHRVTKIVLVSSTSTLKVYGVSLQ